MKSSYRIRVDRRTPYYRHPLQPGSVRAIEEILEGSVLRGSAIVDDGSLVVDILLDRTSHEAALNELLVALQQLGYAWLEASITEWADNMVGGALVGCLGGGTIGANGDKVTALLTALIGALIGAVVGSAINSVKVVYTVYWTGVGWELRPAVPAPTLISRPLPAT